MEPFKLDEEYNVVEQIKERVNLESNKAWAKRELKVPTPAFCRPVVKKNLTWWKNFIKSSIYQLNP